MNEKLLIPASIICAGMIIGGAIYARDTQVQAPNTNTGQGQPTVAAEIDSKKVDPASDNILGSPTADIFLIEYSDLECPFCKRYHDTALKQLKEDYAGDDRVSFVFRHFPLDEPYTRPLHPTATEEAIASECVAKLGGSAAFFAFTDSIFETTNSDGQYDLSQLGGLAAQAGVDEVAFQTCYDNQDTEPLVTASFQEGVAAGVQGTPTVYIQTNEGKTFPGVPDYDALKISIEAYLADLK